MAVHLDYEFDGVNRVNNALRTLAAKHRIETDSVVGAFAKKQRKKLKGESYPTPKRGRQPFKSERQRKYFFWALSQGIISVPYRRTGTLANSWSTSKNSLSNWSVRNSASYTPMVVGLAGQTRYHKGTWWIADKVLREDIGDLTKELATKIAGLAS